jgi:MFS family permease
LFFDRIREHERTSLLTTLNLANAAAMAGGSLLGGAVLSAAGPGREGYHALFLISTAARLVVLLALARLGIGRVPVPSVSFRFLTLRPSLGGLMRPITASFSESRARRKRRSSDTKDR